MDKIINKLRNELLNKEIELLDLDNYILEELDYKTEGIFENVNLALESNSWTYQNIENTEDLEGINIIWELIEENENNFKTVVKIQEIERI